MQDLGYAFDGYGNLTSREDFARDVYESFTYDTLNRLIGSTLKNAETDVVLASKSYRYDAVGNMVNKSDVSASDYVYGAGSAGPHAVTSAGGNTYAYDASGNMVSGAGRTLTWTSFQKPLTIAKGSTTSTFEYGPDRTRVRQVKVKGTVTETVTYVGGMYEQVSKTGTATEHVHYIFAGGVRIAVETANEAAGSSVELRYLHQDHLGSVDVVTNESGAVVERLSFGAFGERRVAQGSTTWQDSALALSSVETRRGFTDHEQLDDFSLVHMNGRVYDPQLGRFLSPDPFVQFALSSQGYNRYTYANNNPLSFTDPSGYFSLGGLIGSIIESVSAPLKWAKKVLAKNDVLRIAVSVGFAFYGGPDLAGLLGFTKGSIGASVVGGFGSGLIASGGDLKSAVVGGLTAGAFNFVGGSEIFGVTELTASRVVAHGVIGGVSSELMGGKFGAGFFSAGFSKLATPYVNDISTAQGRVVASAVIGGTASEIAGGKFANGAMTAAFGRLYNGESSVGDVEKESNLAYGHYYHLRVNICATSTEGCNAEYAAKIYKEFLSKYDVPDHPNATCENGTECTFEIRTNQIIHREYPNLNQSYNFTGSPHIFRGQVALYVGQFGSYVTAGVVGSGPRTTYTKDLMNNIVGINTFEPLLEEMVNRYKK